MKRPLFVILQGQYNDRPHRTGKLGQFPPHERPVARCGMMVNGNYHTVYVLVRRSRHSLHRFIRHSRHFNQTGWGLMLQGWIGVTTATLIDREPVLNRDFFGG